MPESLEHHLVEPHISEHTHSPNMWTPIEMVKLTDESIVYENLKILINFFRYLACKMLIVWVIVQLRVRLDHDFLAIDISLENQYVF